MTHFIEECEHATTVRQCKCPGPKVLRIVPCPGPPVCDGTYIDLDASREEHRPTDRPTDQTDPRGAHLGDDYEGHHAWGPWSRPYRVHGRPEPWQERRCQCGNRDFRPVPV